MSGDSWRVLLIGSGGREHALAWKLAQSPALGRLYAAPGNPGMARHAELVPLDPMRAADVAAWAKANQIDLVVVGPEDPLVNGLVDVVTEAGVPCFGPTRAAAQIEGSKAWAKALMQRHGIPHAAGAAFTDVASARAWLRAHPGPIVVKADGLALGKGVVVADSTDEAEAAVVDMLEHRRFGAASARVVLEERLTGREVSAFAFVDGPLVVPLGFACDYKRIGEGDTGPNTGGMGGFSPPPFVDHALASQIVDQILVRASQAMVSEQRPYRGFLYAGIMVTPDGPRVFEFNCRFGDPEAQLLMPRLRLDLLPMLWRAASDQLVRCPDKLGLSVSFDRGATVGVVLASGGYPADYQRGLPITGVAAAEATGALVFHAGTALRDGQLLTNGGRVLCVVGRGDTIAAARAHAYQAAEWIQFEGRYFRRDIAVDLTP